MGPRLFRWTPDSLERWERVRKRGPFRYILMWTLFSACLNICMALAWYVYFALREPFMLIIIGFVVVVSAVVGPLIGLIYGIVMWHLTERSYARARREQDGSRQPEG